MVSMIKLEVTGTQETELQADDISVFLHYTATNVESSDHSTNFPKLFRKKC